MLESFYTYLESVLSWFFGATILQDSFVALIVKGLEFYFGLWLLWLLIVKPIFYLINVIDSHIYTNK